MKGILKLLPLLLVVSLFFTTSGFAKSENAKKSLVALGDSIPFGYGLTDSMDEPSRDAFPYLIGEAADLRVRNLAVPGWKTSDLLNALNHDQKFIQAVSKADYITLNIGSNDLLKPIKDAYVASGGNLDNEAIIRLINSLGPSAQILQLNISLIVGKINALNPHAKIVLYNFYNPFLFLGESHPINLLGNPLIQTINHALEGLNYPNLAIANAYVIGLSPFYLLSGDIHPSLAGHELLANIGLNALK
ncbi:SGNH/GDSL hydrolase family protein [Neobacillus sp. 114]|uniref:SGNH/GDSL hydrolase family protein n=1 Tax=Neobacillus sp. 114 TaxID=3048535 RepID=UPI0024C21354|nr:SGNH/GDSL hydrolase family protein [Neobacillus sp. 114]